MTPLFLIVFKYYSYCTGLDSGNEDVKDYNDNIEDYYDFNKIDGVTTGAKEDEIEKDYIQEKGKEDKETEVQEVLYREYENIGGDTNGEGNQEGNQNVKEEEKEILGKFEDLQLSDDEDKLTKPLVEYESMDDIREDADGDEIPNEEFEDENNTADEADGDGSEQGSNNDVPRRRAFQNKALFPFPKYEGVEKTKEEELTQPNIEEQKSVKQSKEEDIEEESQIKEDIKGKEMNEPIIEEEPTNAEETNPEIEEESKVENGTRGEEMTEPKIVEESTIGKETEGEETTQSEIDEESTIREEKIEEETPKPDVEAENQIGEEIEEELTTNPASEILEEKEQGTENIHSDGMVRLVYLNTPATMRFKKGNTKETYVNEGESEGTTGEQVINAADTAIVNVEKNHKGEENVDGTLNNKVEDKGQGSEHEEYNSDKMQGTDKEEIKSGMGEYKLVQKDKVCATKMNVLKYFFYFTTKL